MACKVRRWSFVSAVLLCVSTATGCGSDKESQGAPPNNADAARPGSPRHDVQIATCEHEEGSRYISTGTVKNSRPGVADYTITVNFENDLGIHIERSGTPVSEVSPGDTAKWEVITPGLRGKDQPPFDPTIVRCSLEVTRLIDGHQEFATAAPEYARAANEVCRGLRQELDVLSQTTDGWSYRKKHAELSRPVVARLRQLSPVRQDLELLEAFEDWEQFLDQEESVSEQHLLGDDDALEFDWIAQPAYDAQGALGGYGLTDCGETLPSGA